jgi:hypothetical protein
MSEEEGERLFAEQVDRWRNESWETLRSHLNEPVAYEIKGSSAALYQFEVLVFWDGGRRRGPREGNLRVIITGDDGKGWRVFGGMRSDDFIKAPDGSLIGE